MPEILIHVRDKLPQIIGDVRTIVADNSDYTIRFIFDELWEDGAKTVYFVRSNGYVFAPMQTVNDTVAVPVQSDVNMMTWLYVGVQQGDIKTSRPCEIKLLSSIADCIDDDAVQPDEGMWRDVLQRLEYLEEHGGGGTGGSISVEYDDTTGELTITSAYEDDVVYNPENGELTIAGEKNSAGNAPIYGGTYTVVPSAAESQVLQTANRYLESDLTVEKIPFSETDNISGGTTIYIG